MHSSPGTTCNHFCNNIRTTISICIYKFWEQFDSHFISLTSNMSEAYMLCLFFIHFIFLVFYFYCAYKSISLWWIRKLKNNWSFIKDSLRNAATARFLKKCVKGLCWDKPRFWEKAIWMTPAWGAWWRWGGQHGVGEYQLTWWLEWWLLLQPAGEKGWTPSRRKGLRASGEEL